MSASYFDLLKYAATGQASPDMTYYDRMRASTLMGGVVQTLTGQPPLSFKADGTPLTAWSIYGNGQQQGTPTPDNPIQPEFVGVRTGNLFDCDINEGVINNAYIRKSDGATVTDVTYYISYPIYILEGVDYTWTFDNIQVHGVPTVGFYDASDNLIGFAYHGDNVRYFSFTPPSGCKYIRASVYKYNGLKREAMLNLGSTPLPYEPYGWKVPFENHGENLFDASLLVNNMHLDITTGLPIAYTGRIASPDPVDVSQYSTVTISYVTAATTTNAMYSIFSNNELVGRFTAVSSGTVIDVSNADKMYICFYSTWGGNVDTSSVSDIMLNSGSTAKPYSPYLNATIPVYLGEVPTVRRVRKLVLDGTETWTPNARNNDLQIFQAYTNINDGTLTASNVVCSHLETVNSVALTYSRQAISMCSSSTGFIIGISYGVIGTVAGESGSVMVEKLKSYLADEYSAGTPVTVWYVLAAPQTGITNEPLAKIGTYADELHSEDAAVTIPTIKGQNVLTVDTPIQPSEMTITYKG